MAKSVNVEQVGKAVAALQKWLGTKEDQLLEEDELMYLVRG